MNDDEVLVQHMLEATERIETYTEELSKAEFEDDNLVQDAVIRQLEILGEAAKQVSAEIRTEYDTIQWQDIAGMRDKLIHGYFGVDIDVVWETVQQDIQHLQKQLSSIEAEDDQ